MHWPTNPVELEALQRELALLSPEPWNPDGPILIGGCFVCFGRRGSARGSAHDPGWAGAAVMEGRRIVARALAIGESGAPYEPGLLAAREGSLLESSVRGLSRFPDVLLVNGTGQDHPRRAGLAVHLGWALDLPSVGVTHRPLIADGRMPDDREGSRSLLLIRQDQVGWWLRTRRGARPVAVTPGWRTDLDTALEVVAAAVVRARTPEAIREARRLARTARSGEAHHGPEPIATGRAG